MAPQDTATPQVPGDEPAATTMGLSAIRPADLTTSADPQAPVDAGTLTSLQPGTALLRVDHGPNAGSRFLLDADLTTVGRLNSLSGRARHKHPTHVRTEAP